MPRRMAGQGFGTLGGIGICLWRCRRWVPTYKMPVAGEPRPKGCGSVPKENRNRADGRHARCSQ
jgi:hypothetical protein